MKSFRSDNNAGLCPEALRALVEVSAGHSLAYGDDEHTAAAAAEFRRIFGPRASVWFVATGTAANTLAVASLTEPWQQVLCHVHSHYNDDESTAPERITHCRTVQVRTDSSKLQPADLQRAGGTLRGDVHHPHRVRHRLHAAGDGRPVRDRPRRGLSGPRGRGALGQRGGRPGV